MIFPPDIPKTTRSDLQRETEVFHIPFRIPSFSSLSKSQNFIETDLSKTFCEMVLEEEEMICTDENTKGTIFHLSAYVRFMIKISNSHMINKLYYFFLNYKTKKSR